MLYGSLAETEETQIIVDSTKNPIRMKLLYLTRPSQLKIIFLVRDGRAVAASARRRLGISISQAARRWKRASWNLLWVLKTIPNTSIYRLRYEDLCDQPDIELGKLCKFIGVEKCNSILEFGDTL